MIKVPPMIRTLAARGATFVVNHSAGKDSQCMYLAIRALVPASQIVLVYADLGDVVWPGTLDHIKATTAGEPLYVCNARRNLLDMIEERGMFPSPRMRWCTSDLKRGPIEKTIRKLGVKLIVNCMGMRAEESSNRSKLEVFKYSERNSKAGREWYEWLPIHALTTDQVFSQIAAAGQLPHWAYSMGMTRLSCCFCIMSSKKDLTVAAQLNPGLYRQYVQLEKSTGQVMLMPTKTQGRRTLEEVTGVIVSSSAEAARQGEVDADPRRDTHKRGNAQPDQSPTDQPVHVVG